MTSKTMSSDFTWNDTEESFCFLHKSWDVQAAKAIIRDKPREVGMVLVSDLEPFLAKSTHTPSGGTRIRAGITLDLDLADPSIDLSMPLIGAITKQGNALPIDGWHRVARAVRDGVDTLPIVFLTKAESRGIEC